MKREKKENWDELADAAEKSDEGRQAAWTAMRNSALRDSKKDEKKDHLARLHDKYNSNYEGGQ